MSRSIWQLAVVVTVVVAATAPARADLWDKDFWDWQRWKLNVTAAGFVGWSDNVLNAPVDDPLGGPGPQEDVYTEVRPGLLAAFETPRTVHNLVYELVGTVYQTHSEANSLTNRLGHLALFLISPALEINTQSFLVIGETNQFASGRPTDGGMIGVLPSGSQDFVELNLQENLNYTPRPEWRYSQQGQFRLVGSQAGAMDTDTTTVGYELVAAGGVQRVWQDDALGLEASLGQMLFHSRFDGDGRTSTQLNANLVGSWVHNYTQTLSSRLFAGASEILLLTGETGRVTQPIGGGSLGWSSGIASITATASRSTGAELFIGQNTVTDTASLSGWLLVWQFEADSPYDDPSSIGINGGVAASRYRLFDGDTAEFLGDSETRSANAAIAWQNRAYGVAARYAWIDQDVDEEVQRTSLLPYDRQTVMVTIYGRFPERIGPVVPQRNPLRVQSESEETEEERRIGPRNERPGPF